jgi:preprotein translocase subunit SecE
MSKNAVKKQGRFKGKISDIPKRIIKYFIGMWSEVKKITWLTRKELIQHTGVVLGLVAIMTLIFWIADTILGAATSLFL